MMTVSQASEKTESQFMPPTDSQARVSQLMKQIQDEICEGLEQMDGVSQFQEDSWERPEGGGGRSRVLQEGGVLEQGG
jgi:coproporphyrinogen III oxidase